MSIKTSIPRSFPARPRIVSQKFSFPGQCLPFVLDVHLWDLWVDGVGVALEMLYNCLYYVKIALRSVRHKERTGRKFFLLISLTINDLERISCFM